MGIVFPFWPIIILHRLWQIDQIVSNSYDLSNFRYVLGCPLPGFQSPPGLCTIFRIGDPNLNLHLPSWEGGQPKPCECSSSVFPVTFCTQEATSTTSGGVYLSCQKKRRLWWFQEAPLMLDFRGLKSMRKKENMGRCLWPQKIVQVTQIIPKSIKEKSCWLSLH